MADMKKIATRVSYGNTLVELARQGADNLVVFDADLAAATKTEIFRKEFPDRHFDCGIAEQNMVGVAAGMSTMGYVPFVSSFAMFVAGRGFEQIRNSIGYPHLNVKIAATHAGLSVGEDGASRRFAAGHLDKYSFTAARCNLRCRRAPSLARSKPVYTVTVRVTNRPNGGLGRRALCG